MKRMMGAILFALMLLTASALAADLDTPRDWRGGLCAGGGKRLGRAA